MSLRSAHIANKLHFNSSLQSIGTLYGAAQRVLAKKATSAPREPTDDNILTEFTNSGAFLAVASARDPIDSLAMMQRQIHLCQSFNAEIAAMPVYRRSARVAFRKDGYAEWQWPFLLQRYIL